MKGINKWHGIGNCCADAAIKYMPSGSAVTSITVACNDSYKDKTTGEKVEKTEFIKVVFFNQLAEIAGKYLNKGSQVYVEGSLRTRKWQNKEGVDQYTTEIVANEMQMMGGKSDSAPAKKAPTQVAQATSGGDPFDDSIPF